MNGCRRSKTRLNGLNGQNDVKIDAFDVGDRETSCNGGLERVAVHLRAAQSRPQRHPIEYQAEDRVSTSHVFEHQQTSAWSQDAVELMEGAQRVGDRAHRAGSHDGVKARTGELEVLGIGPAKFEVSAVLPRPLLGFAQHPVTNVDGGDGLTRGKMLDVNSGSYGGKKDTAAHFAENGGLVGTAPVVGRFADVVEACAKIPNSGHVFNLAGVGPAS